MVADKLSNISEKPRTLSILVPNGCQANLQPLVAFLATKLDIELELISAPVDEINTQLRLAGLPGGRAYDLALPATFGLPGLAKNGVIQPLDSYVARHEPEHFQRDALYTAGDYFDDQFYGYQTDGDAYLMFYNRDWLENKENQKRYEDQFGEILSAPKTWVELDRHIAFFHKPQQGQFGGSLFRTPDYLHWEWWLRFHAKGYFPLKDDLTPQIANDEGISALEDLISTSKSLTKGSQTNGLFDNWREFAEGDSYCNIGWGGTQKYLNSDKSKIRGKLLHTTTPGGLIGNKIVTIPYFNWGWNYTVPTNARYPEAAYLCSLLASTPELSTLAVREDGFFDPYREAHYSDDVIQSMYTEDFLAAHKMSMKNSIPDFYLIGQSNYMSVLKTNLYRAMNGDLTPKRALDSVAKAWTALHYRYGLEAQQTTWLKIKQRYPTQIRALLK